MFLQVSASERSLSDPTWLHSRLRRPATASCVLALHLLALWGLSQLDGVRQAVLEAAPIVVRLVATAADPRPDPPPVPTAQPARRPDPPLLPVPLVSVAAAPEPAPIAPPPPPVATTSTPAAANPAAPTPTVAAPLPAPPPPSRRLIDASAVRYLVEPPAEVPRLSRRAGEHGVVWLRVVVSRQGLPLHVSVARSSGYPRLDEQALRAMRQARFKPHTEDGLPVEVEVTAPVEYPAD